jgi:hypothetical protein
MRRLLQGSHLRHSLRLEVRLAGVGFLVCEVVMTNDHIRRRLGQSDRCQGKTSGLTVVQPTAPRIKFLWRLCTRLAGGIFVSYSLPILIGLTQFALLKTDGRLV